MGYTITAPVNSFVQFQETGEVVSCGFKPTKLCLPVYYDDDVAFQFIVTADTALEAAALCGPYGIRPTVGITTDCETFALEFDGEQPETFRMDELHVLMQWPHGLPGFTAVITPGQCFNIMIELLDESVCSNCFYRLAALCWTTEIEYSNNDNFAGFNYCSGGTAPDPNDQGCEQLFFPFTNQDTLVIPYTASLQAQFGTLPSVQVWIFDIDGTLVDMGTRVAFDTYPPTEIRFNFGGSSSGVVRISN